MTNEQIQKERELNREAENNSSMFQQEYEAQQQETEKNAGLSLLVLAILSVIAGLIF